MSLAKQFIASLLTVLDSVSSSTPSRGDEKQAELEKQLEYFVPVELVSGKPLEAKEVFTGKFFTGKDGVERRVYQKAIHADSFQVANNYGWIKHGIPYSDKIVPMEVGGYIAGNYAPYANYWYLGGEGEAELEGSVQFYWTGTGAYEVYLILTYAK